MAGRIARVVVAMLLATVLGGGLVAPASAGGGVTADPLSVEAMAIHERTFTIDSHIDIPFVFGSDLADPGLDGTWQVDLPKLQAGGLDGGFFVVYVGQKERDIDAYARAETDAQIKVAAIRSMVERYPDKIGLVATAADARAIHDDGKLVAMIGVKNGYVIGESVALLAHYRGLGARYMTLVHNGHNAIGDSAVPDPELGDEMHEHGGLTEFGRSVIAEMNRPGIVVDISHAERQTMFATITMSASPVIASHSNARALVDIPRNLDDEHFEPLRRTMVSYKRWPIPAMSPRCHPTRSKLTGHSTRNGI